MYVIFFSQKNIPPLFCVFSAPHPVEGCCHLLFDACSKIVLYVLYFFDLIACSLYFCWYFYFRLAGGYTWAQKRNVSFLGKIWSKFTIGFLVSFRPNWANKLEVGLKKMAFKLISFQPGVSGICLFRAHLKSNVDF